MNETSERRRAICLDYLSRVAADMYGDRLAGKELFEKSRQRLTYITLALQYGCLKNEIRMALGITAEHLDQLIKTIEK